MAQFDFAQSATAGYRFVWQNRHNIVPFATMPLVVKIASYALVVLLSLKDNYFRQGLILLPGYFLEGFVVVIAIRMALYGENYAHLLKAGQRKTVPDDISKSIMSAVVIYLLTKLISSFLTATAMSAPQIETAAAPVLPPPNGAPMLTSFMILMFMIWIFKYFWLYVPAAMGVPINRFLISAKPFMTSIYMLGLWLVCTVPFLILMLSISSFVKIIFGDAGFSLGAALIMSITHSITELIVAVISGVGMAIAVQKMMAAAGNKR